MRASTLRTVIVSRTDLVDVQASLDKLRNGKALTAAESGVVAVAPIGNLELAGEPQTHFDGFKWTVFLFVGG